MAGDEHEDGSSGRNGGERDSRVTGPSFEMVVLGSGGGPLETDCSGYLVKPCAARWEEGMLALEGGSGLGALATLLQTRQDEMFPNVTFPKNYNTPVLKAAYIFSYLTCYLITHAHLDHTLSLIMLSGSVPPRPSVAQHPQPPIMPPTPVTGGTTSAERKVVNAPQAQVPVFGTKETLERLSMAYGGGLWPELGYWAPEGAEDHGGEKRKRRKISKGTKTTTDGCGVVLSPVKPSRSHRPLHPALPFTTLAYPVAHGCTSKGLYESSAVFIRYDPSAISDESERDVGTSKGMREFLFFGDVESAWRKEGEEDISPAGKEGATRMNREIWDEAAKGWNEGRLAGIFIECSYASDRPANLMFGHISPPGLFHELGCLAAEVKGTKDARPLEGLKVYVTHIKEALVPHESGQSARTRILGELRALEKERQLGVMFVCVEPGDRILI